MFLFVLSILFTFSQAISLPVKIGFFIGNGTSHNLVPFLETLNTAATAAFRNKSNYVITNMTAEQVHHLVVNETKKLNYDIVVFPGGSGNGMADDIGKKGLEQIQNFVSLGGGYIGTCGGAFVAIQHALLYGPGPTGHGPPTQEPYNRGHGLVNVSFTKQGIDALGLSNSYSPGQNVTIMYWQGPIVKDIDFPENILRWGIFESEIHNLYPNKTTGEMIHTPGITATKYGKGRVVLNSPHPELDPQVPNIYEGELRWVLDN